MVRTYGTLCYYRISSQRIKIRCHKIGWADGPYHHYTITTHNTWNPALPRLWRVVECQLFATIVTWYNSNSVSCRWCCQNQKRDEYCSRNLKLSYKLTTISDVTIGLASGKVWNIDIILYVFLSWSLLLPLIVSRFRCGRRFGLHNNEFRYLKQLTLPLLFRLLR